jgi:hypothetical protein
VGHHLYLWNLLEIAVFWVFNDFQFTVVFFPGQHIFIQSMATLPVDVLLGIVSFLPLSDKRNFRLLNKEMKKKMKRFLLVLPVITTEKQIRALVKRCINIPHYTWCFEVERVHSSRLQKRMNQELPLLLMNHFKGTQMEEVIPTIKIWEMIHFGYDCVDKQSEDDVTLLLDVNGNQLEFFFWIKYCLDGDMKCWFKELHTDTSLIDYKADFSFDWLTPNIMDKKGLKKVLRLAKVTYYDELGELFSIFLCGVIEGIMNIIQPESCDSEIPVLLQKFNNKRRKIGN